MPPHRRRLSMVLGVCAVPHPSAFENVAFGLHIRGVGREELGRTEPSAGVRLGGLAAT